MRIVNLILLLLFASSVSAAADLYIYPNTGQNQEQQRRDKYECHVWAAQQTGFDPSTYPSPQPVQYASVTTVEHHPHPEINPLTGAAGGAALGAVGGAIGGDAGKGAAIGAGVGALVGAFYTLFHQQHDRNYKHQAATYTKVAVDDEELRNDYNRAISACLEGRDYTVK